MCIMVDIKYDQVKIAASFLPWGILFIITCSLWVFLLKITTFVYTSLMIAYTSSCLIIINFFL